MKNVMLILIVSGLLTGCKFGPIDFGGDGGKSKGVAPVAANPNCKASSCDAASEPVPESSPSPTSPSPTLEPSLVIEPSPTPTPVVEVPYVAISKVDSFELPENGSVVKQLVAQANGPVLFRCKFCPSFLSLDASTGSMALSPGFEQAGSYSVEVEAVNDTSVSLESFTVGVVNVNRLPTSSPSGDQSTLENQALDFAVSAIDPDGGDPVIEVLNLPSGASLNAQSHVIWTPSYNQSGTYPVTIRAHDSTEVGVFTDRTINILVSNSNRAPSVSVTNQTLSENSAFNYPISTSDPDGDSVIVSSSNLPAGASITNNILSWTPSCQQEGDYNVTLNATDGNLIVNQNLNLHVNHTNCEGVVLAGKSNPYWLHFNDTDMNYRLISFYQGTYPSNADGALKYRFAGIWFDCFDQAFTFQNLGNTYLHDSSWAAYNVYMPYWSADAGHETLKVTNPAPYSHVSDLIWILMYAEDVDGDKNYIWIKYFRNSATSYSTVQKIDQGSSYNTTGFCSTTINPNGFVHTIGY